MSDSILTKKFEGIINYLYNTQELNFAEAAYFLVAIKHTAKTWTPELTEEYGEMTKEIAEELFI